MMKTKVWAVIATVVITIVAYVVYAPRPEKSVAQIRADSIRNISEMERKDSLCAWDYRDATATINEKDRSYYQFQAIRGYGNRMSLERGRCMIGKTGEAMFRR